MSRAARALASLGLLVIVAGLGAAAVAVALVPAMNGTRAVTIDAPSMQRVLPMGSLVYIAKEPIYDIGMVVTYRHNGNTVTHEIVDWLPNPKNAVRDGWLLQTKGTENAQVDPYMITRDQIEGRVVSHIPWLGLLVRNLSALPTQIFIATLALALYLASRPPRREDEPIPVPV